MGYDPATGATKALAEIEGHIISTFMELKKQLASMHASLAAFNTEAQGYFAQIADAPADYTYPAAIPAQAALATRAEDIKEELALVQDDLEDILNRNANAAQQGHFGPLMLDIKKAYQTKEGLVGLYRGQVTTLANSIADYRQKLIEKSRINRLLEASTRCVGSKGSRLCRTSDRKTSSLRPRSKPPPSWSPAASRSARTPEPNRWLAPAFPLTAGRPS